MFKKEKINKFIIDLGVMPKKVRGYDKEKLYIEVEYSDVKDKRVNISYWIGMEHCGIKEFMSGTHIYVEGTTSDIEKQVFKEVKNLYYCHYFDEEIEEFYKTLVDLEIMSWVRLEIE